MHLPPAEVGNEHVDELLDWWLEQPLQVGFLPTPVAEQAFRRSRQHPTLRTLLIGGDRLRQFDSAPGFAVINKTTARLKPPWWRPLVPCSRAGRCISAARRQ
ncbi:amino acid adenylation, partial [Pseudomonas syringae pv. japonica str. M301072]